MVFSSQILAQPFAVQRVDDRADLRLPRCAFPLLLFFYGCPFPLARSFWHLRPVRSLGAAFFLGRFQQRRVPFLVRRSFTVFSRGLRCTPSPFFLPRGKPNAHSPVPLSLFDFLFFQEPTCRSTRGDFFFASQGPRFASRPPQWPAFFFVCASSLTRVRNTRARGVPACIFALMRHPLGSLFAWAFFFFFFFV